jgi:hypothetical protein
VLRVIVEIHPGGDEARKHTIATVDLGNISELRPVSDYTVHAKLDDRPEIRGVVLNHTRADGWVPLVVRALESLQPKASVPATSPCAACGRGTPYWLTVEGERVPCCGRFRCEVRIRDGVDVPEHAAPPPEHDVVADMTPEDLRAEVEGGRIAYADLIEDAKRLRKRVRELTEQVRARTSPAQVALWMQEGGFEVVKQIAAWVRERPLLPAPPLLGERLATGVTEALATEIERRFGYGGTWWSEQARRAREGKVGT